jgi:MoCo/4Fe-4S cofactor protein with predicted Tat translocation signal
MNPPLDLNAIRRRLAGKTGLQYWRSLEELAQTPEFQEMLLREFPNGASEWWDGLSRRNFLKYAAASLALAGVTACTRQPAETILPYVHQPENLVLGEPRFYATAMTLGGFASGVLAKSREGHPIKIEGNPQHPMVLGGSNVWTQASILDLYDPDRSQAVARAGEASTWNAFLWDLNDILHEQRAKQGSGLRVLTETVTSPALAAQLDGVLKDFPRAQWHQFESVSRDHVLEGARLAFGEVLETHYRLEKATVIVSLDSDFLYTHPARLLYTRQFTNGRRVAAGADRMNRLYVAEPTPTVTGSMADHRLPLSMTAVQVFIHQLANRILRAADTVEELEAHESEFLEIVAADLEQNHGKSLVLAGEWQPPQVHAIAHLLNDRLGNVGQTVFYAEPAGVKSAGQLDSLRALATDMRAGKVEALFILGANPGFTAPADFEFTNLLKQVPHTIHLGTHLDETGRLCKWHIPQLHYLEGWSDARAFDGTVSVVQPLIAPLFNGHSAHELLELIAGHHPVRSDYEIVREFWRTRKLWADFDLGWRRVLHEGFIQGTAAAAKSAKIRNVLPQRASTSPGAKDRSLELCFRPDPNLWDGRFANNGWLQECPKPLNQLSWDNALFISPALAQKQNLTNGDIIVLQTNYGDLRGAVWIMPGQAENSITTYLGHGRSGAGRIGTNVGFAAEAVRTRENFWRCRNVKVYKTPARHLLVTTQTHHTLHSPDRQVFRGGDFREWLRNRELIKESTEQPKTPETLYYPEEYPYTGYKWGMSIDLNTCIGCNACLVACEAENNIPVVGKDQVHRRREMFWIRVDTYYKGTLENPEFNHMPVPCMHCEHAPCELVCPVAATVHDHEGLNLQVYNRCVGTRFCSNNCPYKVRRFNFFQYTQYKAANLEPLYNPEVTVRWRGVMEKCTYCIQRISRARIAAEKENRRIADGEIVTACQQACPAEAIVFGDLNDPHSKVSRLKNQPLDYSMLGELNTRPRTTYSAKLRNPGTAGNRAMPAFSSVAVKEKT